MALITCKECKKQVSNKSNKCPHCGAPITKPVTLSGVLKWLAVLFIGYFVYTCTTAYEQSSGTATDQQGEKIQLLNQMDIDFKWSKTGFDNIMQANFTITNNNPTAVKDIKITCTHYAKSGTRIDDNSETIYQIIPANQTQQFNEISMGFIHTQTDATSCRIVSVQSA